MDYRDVHVRHNVANSASMNGRVERFRVEWMTGAENSAPSTAPTAAPSRFPVWLVAIGLGVPLALILLAASPLGTDFIYVMVGIPALLFTWTIAGAATLVVSARFAKRREWRRCVIALALPIALLVVALDPFRFVRSCNYIGDVVHFIISKPYYDREIAALRSDQRPRLLVFDWGGMTWASSGLVYDETDQVSLPKGHQSADWLAQASHSELSCEGYGVQPLWDHYYLASFPC
jgi:hypothetical protein